MLWTKFDIYVFITVHAETSAVVAILDFQSTQKHIPCRPPNNYPLFFLQMPWYSGFRDEKINWKLTWASVYEKGLLMRTVCVCLSHSLLASSCVRKPSSPIIVSHTVRPMWPIYGNLLEVVYGNWMLRGSRQNHKVSEKTRPLDARHAWPTGVWICTGVCKPSSQLWVK